MKDYQNYKIDIRSTKQENHESCWRLFATDFVDSMQQSNQVKYPFMKSIESYENSYFLLGYYMKIGSGAKLTDDAYDENDTLFVGI